MEVTGTDMNGTETVTPAIENTGEDSEVTYNTVTENDVTTQSADVENECELEDQLYELVIRAKHGKTPEITQVSPVSKVYVVTSDCDTDYYMGFAIKTFIETDQVGRCWASHQVDYTEDGGVAWVVGLRQGDILKQLDGIDTDGMYHDDLLDQFLIIEWSEVSMLIKRQDVLYLVEAKFAVKIQETTDSGHLVVEGFTMTEYLQQVESPEVCTTENCKRVSRVSKDITVVDQIGEKPAIVQHCQSQFYIQVHEGRIVIGPLTTGHANLSHCMYNCLKSSHTGDFGELITFQTSEGNKTAYISAITSSRVQLKKSKKVGRHIKFLNADDPRLFFRRDYDTRVFFYVAQFARRGKLCFLACKNNQLFLKSMSHCDARSDPDVQFKLY